MHPMENNMICRPGAQSLLPVGAASSAASIRCFLSTGQLRSPRWTRLTSLWVKRCSSLQVGWLRVDLCPR